jgi:hypothetical protein
MQPNYNEFFTRYVSAYNQALTKKPDIALIRSFFTKRFLGAGPGSVTTGKNGFVFSLVLRGAYFFYKKIGTKHLNLRQTQSVRIDETHDLVKVQYSSEYAKKTGEAITIDFEVAYLTQHDDSGIKIFAFVAGDEMKAYKDAGLV